MQVSQQLETQPSAQDDTQLSMQSYTQHSDDIDMGPLPQFGTQSSSRTLSQQPQDFGTRSSSQTMSQRPFDMQPSSWTLSQHLPDTQPQFRSLSRKTSDSHSSSKTMSQPPHTIDRPSSCRASSPQYVSDATEETAKEEDADEVDLTVFTAVASLLEEFGSWSLLEIFETAGKVLEDDWRGPCLAQRCLMRKMNVEDNVGATTQALRDALLQSDLLANREKFHRLIQVWFAGMLDGHSLEALWSGAKSFGVDNRSRSKKRQSDTPALGEPSSKAVKRDRLVGVEEMTACYTKVTAQWKVMGASLATLNKYKPRLLKACVYGTSADIAEVESRFCVEAAAEKIACS